MAIGNVTKALTGFVKQAGQKTADVATTAGKRDAIQLQMSAIDTKMSRLSGWSPESKIERQALTSQKRELQRALNELPKALPSSQELAARFR